DHTHLVFEIGGVGQKSALKMEPFTLSRLALLSHFVSTYSRCNRVAMLHLVFASILLTARVWNGLGEAARAQGHYEEAVFDFTRAYELDRADAASLYNLGTVYRRLGRYNDADRAVRQALDTWEKPPVASAPKLAAGYSLLAGIRADRGRYKEALQYYDR